MECGVQCAERAVESTEFVGRAEQVCLPWPVAVGFSVATDLKTVKCESTERTSSGAVGLGPSGVQEVGVGKASGCG